MRQLPAGLAITGLALTGCAATASTSSGNPPAAVTSHEAAAATGSSGAAAARAGLGGLSSGGTSGPAQWVVDGTFEAGGGTARPLSGTVTFRDSATGHTVNVAVGASGKFSLGLVAGTYTATGKVTHQASPCSALATVTVRAGQLTRVSLVCKTA
jgi:hypothetical protein